MGISLKIGIFTLNELLNNSLVSCSSNFYYCTLNILIEALFFSFLFLQLQDFYFAPFFYTSINKIILFYI